MLALELLKSLKKQQNMTLMHLAPVKEWKIVDTAAKQSRKIHDGCQVKALKN